jgi:hypothetical protein
MLFYLKCTQRWHSGLLTLTGVPAPQANNLFSASCQPELHRRTGDRGAVHSRESSRTYNSPCLYVHPAAETT